MRRLSHLIAVIAALVAFLPSFALAQTDSVEEVGSAAGFGGAGLMEIIGTVISVVLGFLGVVFLILLIASGFMWMTAGGSEDKVKRAKTILINATIGLVIVLTSYGIASFLLNAFGDATGVDPNGTNGDVTIPPRSGSLGSGSIRDHYPARNATDIARNTRIIITFDEAMDLESFIEGYDTNDTPDDTSDDTVATTINADLVQIYPTADESAALTDVTVNFTEDLKTFVFDPADYLGSATEDTSYTVSLSTNIVTADGDDAFTGLYDGGYEWSFEVGTTIDLDPPSVQSVAPVRDRSYDRNIVVEITFDEAIDPTSATGTRTATSGFQNIQTVGSSAAPEAGTYEISNGYRTITFTPSSACSEDGSVVTNSCGEAMYCLPGGQTITVTAYAASAVNDPPQADSFPYDGVVDTAANSLDGDDDGTAGDDYDWSFTTTDDINLEGAAIESISPDILGTNQSLDQEVIITFDDLMRVSTLTSENITMENYEQSLGDTHEMWFLPRAISLDSTGAEVTDDETQSPVKTQVSIDHGVFLESEGGLTYLYGVMVNEGVQNQYQNCYSPAEGPDENGAACGVDENSPSCCNGDAQSETCDFFPDPTE